MTKQALPLPDSAVPGHNTGSELWGWIGDATLKQEGGPQDMK